MSDVQDNSEPVAAPAPTTTFEVKAEHANIIMRAIALLERGEKWIADNIEAGITHFEGIVNVGEKDEKAAADGPQDTQS
jgi:hypothetical protein